MVLHMEDTGNLKRRNLSQIEEALGDDNRHFFTERHGRPPHSDEELMRYYVQNGGAEGFARRCGETPRR